MKNLVLIAALVFSVMLVNAQGEKKVNGAEISFPKTTHDYGTIILNGDGTYNFEFTNTGNEPLILTKPRSHKAGSFNKTVTVYSNAKNKSTVLLRIKGKVVTKPAEALPEKDKSVGATPINK